MLRANCPARGDASRDPRGLRSFRADLTEYESLLKGLWRTHQDRWLTAATDDQRDRMEELRCGLGLK
jgi:hypothetical protein